MTLPRAKALIKQAHMNSANPLKELDLAVEVIVNELRAEHKRTRLWGMRMRDQAHKFNHEIQRINNAT